MKVLVLTSYYPPLGHSGHAERCRNTVEGLSILGHRVQVLTSNYRLPSVGIPSEKGVIRRLRLTEGSNGDGSHATNFRELYTHEKQNVWVLNQQMDGFQPDVVLVWSLGQLSRSLAMCVQNGPVPVVFDLHSNWLIDADEMDPWVQWWVGNGGLMRQLKQVSLSLRGMRGRIMREAPLVDPEQMDFTHSYVCSQSLRDRIGGIGADTSALEVLYPAARDSRIPAKVAFGPVRRLVWAGQMSYGKDPMTAVRAMQQLKRDGLELTLDIYGMGGAKARKQLRAEIVRLGMQDCVFPKGIRPGEMPGLYREYDGLLFTSRHHDPFPMTPVEAAYAQLPCVLARDGGVVEVFEHGRSAIFFDPGDPESLAGAIRQLVESADAGRQMAIAARENFQAQHSFARYLAAVERKLKNAAGVE